MGKSTAIMAMKCIDQMVLPMIRPPFASVKLDSNDSLSASCSPDVSVSAVSDPMMPTKSETTRGEV